MTTAAIEITIGITSKLVEVALSCVAFVGGSIGNRNYICYHINNNYIEEQFFFIIILNCY